MDRIGCAYTWSYHGLKTQTNDGETSPFLTKIDSDSGVGMVDGGVVDN
jgi:hypothetical protein